MNGVGSRPKKSPSSKARNRAGTTYRAEYRAWRASLPTPLERDTLLWPEVIAESVVAEASRYLNAELPTDFPARLAAKAYHLYLAAHIKPRCRYRRLR